MTYPSLFEGKCRIWYKDVSLLRFILQLTSLAHPKKQVLFHGCDFNRKQNNLRLTLKE